MCIRDRYGTVKKGPGNRKGTERAEDQVPVPGLPRVQNAPERHIDLRHFGRKIYEGRPTREKGQAPKYHNRWRTQPDPYFERFLVHGKNGKRKGSVSVFKILVEQAGQ